MYIDPYLNHVYLKPGNYVNPILKEYREKSGIHNSVFRAIDLSQQLYEGYCRNIHDYSYMNLKGINKKKQRKTMMAPKFISKDLATMIHTGKFEIIIDGDPQVQELFEKVKVGNDLLRN